MHMYTYIYMCVYIHMCIYTYIHMMAAPCLGKPKQIHQQQMKGKALHHLASELSSGQLAPLGDALRWPWTVGMLFYYIDAYNTIKPYNINIPMLG